MGGLRIPVKTDLNVSNWKEHLVDYFDQQLIEFGFPLDFDRSRDLQSTLVNYALACLYPDHVDRYINEEVGSDSRRTIMDLSFPKGLSVNDGVLKDTYLGTDFQMHYPSVDSII